MINLKKQYFLFVLVTPLWASCELGTNGTNEEIGAVDNQKSAKKNELWISSHLDAFHKEPLSSSAAQEFYQEALDIRDNDNDLSYENMLLYSQNLVFAAFAQFVFPVEDDAIMAISRSSPSVREVIAEASMAYKENNFLKVREKLSSAVELHKQAAFGSLTKPTAVLIDTQHSMPKQPHPHFMRYGYSARDIAHLNKLVFGGRKELVFSVNDPIIEGEALNRQSPGTMEPTEEKRLSPVDFEQCRHEAAVWRDAFEAEPDDLPCPTYNMFVSGEIVFPLPPTPHVQLAEKREHERALFKELMEYESQFVEKILPLLSDDQGQACYDRYMQPGNTKLPSEILWKVIQHANLMDDNVRLLHEQLTDWDFNKYGRFISSRNFFPAFAANRLFEFYIRKYNQLIMTVGEPMPKDLIHKSLVQAKRWLNNYAWAGGGDISEPDSPLAYVYDHIKKSLHTFRWLYVNEMALYNKLSPAILSPLQPAVLYIGRSLLDCTAYGSLGSANLQRNMRHDLLHCLVKLGFTGFYDPHKEQHIWVHSSIPLEVRVKKNGQYSVEIIGQSVFIKGGLDKKLLTQEAETAVLKISRKDTMVPARHSPVSNVFKNLWHNEERVAGSMQAVYRTISRVDFNFKNGKRYLAAGVLPKPLHPSVKALGKKEGTKH